MRTKRGLYAVCTVEGCDREHYAKSYCEAHWDRVKRNGDPAAHIPIGGSRRNVCRVEGCDRFVRGHGLCPTHFARFKRTGDVRADIPIKLARRPRDVPYKDAKGYIQVYRPDHPGAWTSGWIPEHRLVMSEALGRPLAADEVVHHRNGDRADNRPENLELWTRSHPDGQRVQDVLRWAKEFVARYE